MAVSAFSTNRPWQDSHSLISPTTTFLISDRVMRRETDRERERERESVQGAFDCQSAFCAISVIIRYTKAGREREGGGRRENANLKDREKVRKERKGERKKQSGERKK